MSQKVKVAAVQMEPVITANRRNQGKIIFYIKQASGRGARLVVFPECALSGYVYTSREDALPYMETVPGNFTRALEDCCRENGTLVVAGLLEKEGEHCYNSAVLVGPQGLIGKYRKIHLPFLGIDRFLDRGDLPFKVYPTPAGNVGMYICYDCTFPESSRVMTLLGADILALPTNWPVGREKVTRFILPARAYENRVSIIAADRVGSERGADFLGLSTILDCQGETLAQAGRVNEEVIYSEIDLDEGRQKRVVIKPGEFEMDFLADRRPEFYTEICRKKNG
jgi:5-aminopentanamidase